MEKGAGLGFPSCQEGAWPSLPAWEVARVAAVAHTWLYRSVVRSPHTVCTTLHAVASVSLPRMRLFQQRQPRTRTGSRWAQPPPVWSSTQSLEERNMHVSPLPPQGVAPLKS